MLPTLFAEISGQALIETLVWVCAVGLVFWLLWWLVTYIAPPEPFNKVVRVIIAVVAVLFLINIILSLAGHPVVRW